MQQTPYGVLPDNVGFLREIIPFEPGGEVELLYSDLFDPNHKNFRSLKIYSTEELESISKKRKDKSMNKAVEEAIQKKGFGSSDRRIITTHHNLRGASIFQQEAFEALAKAGLKNLFYRPSATFGQDADWVAKHPDFFKYIMGSMREQTGALLLDNSLGFAPGIFGSHGHNAVLHVYDMPIYANFQPYFDENGRAKTPHLIIVPASQADIYGNATGIDGKNAYGPMCFFWNIHDLKEKNPETYVMVVTDELTSAAPAHTQLPHWMVDSVVKIDSLVLPDVEMASGSLGKGKDIHEEIGKAIMEFAEYAGLIQPGASYQSGAGKASGTFNMLLTNYLTKNNIILDFSLGGLTGQHLQQMANNVLKRVYLGQAFDEKSSRILSDPEYREKVIAVDAISSYHPFYQNVASRQTFGVLNGFQFCYDPSDGRLIAVNANSRLKNGQIWPFAGTGGSQDMAFLIHKQGGVVIYAGQTIVKDQISVVPEDEFLGPTIPGEYVDAYVTAIEYEKGKYKHIAAVNPESKKYDELMQKLRSLSNLDVMSFPELRRYAEKAYEKTTGSAYKPHKLNKDYNRPVILVPHSQGTGFVGAHYALEAA